MASARGGGHWAPWCGSPEGHPAKVGQEAVQPGPLLGWALGCGRVVPLAHTPTGTHGSHPNSPRAGFLGMGGNFIPPPGPGQG